MAEELTQRKWSGNELSVRREGDEEKLVVARWLREETTLILAWIAERLKMGTKTRLPHLSDWRHRNK